MWQRTPAACARSSTAYRHYKAVCCRRVAAHRHQQSLQRQQQLHATTSMLQIVARCIQSAFVCTSHQQAVDDVRCLGGRLAVHVCIISICTWMRMSGWPSASDHSSGSSCMMPATKGRTSSCNLSMMRLNRLNACSRHSRCVANYTTVLLCSCSSCRAL